MTDRERLIEIIEKPINILDSGDLYGAIADHLLKNGVIVPPCKVGDTVYIITTKHPCYACNFCTDFCHTCCLIDDRDKRVVKRAIVCSIELGAINKICTEVEKTQIAQAYKYTFWFEDFGETVFLTKKEAEKALEERREQK